MLLTLRQTRRLRDKRQDEMAEMLDIHVQTYRKLEENPDIVMIEPAKKSLNFLMLLMTKIFYCLNLFKID